MDPLWLLVIILLVLWVAGFGFQFGGNLIHLILAIVVIIIVVRLAQGRSV